MTVVHTSNAEIYKTKAERATNPKINATQI